MAEFNPTQVLHGSGGTAWLNGQKLATLQSVELKVTGDFEDINLCGDTRSYQIFNGFSGEGTLTYLKVDSGVLALAAQAYRSGMMPEIKIITNVTQRGTNKSERIAVNGVTVTEFMLAKFEKKAKIEEEIPIKFADFEILEKI